MRDPRHSYLAYATGAGIVVQHSSHRLDTILSTTLSDSFRSATARGANRRRRATHSMPETVSQAPDSAWGDDVGPRASADTPPETRFPARRSRFAERAVPGR
jgi:hypothetical protein